MTLPTINPDNYGLIDPSTLPPLNPSSFRMPLAYTIVVGTCFRGDPFELTAGLKEGDVLKLVREPQNRYDPRAIKVLNQDGMHIGYVPRIKNEVISNLMDAGKHMVCEITWMKEYFDGPEIGIRISMDDF